ncbi:MAG: hypothetical protein KGJ80_01480 [Chloroflexota bacterium]|nr:hypothetical protein [Chloroflexota bacterium]
MRTIALSVLLISLVAVASCMPVSTATSVLSATATFTADPTAMATTVSSATPTFTTTPSPTPLPTETATLPPTSTPTKAPTPTFTPGPLETLGAPKFVYTTPMNMNVRNDRLEWWPDAWIYRQETHGTISMVNTKDFPDANSPHAPKTSQVFKYRIDSDVTLEQDTWSMFAAEGPPIKASFSVKLSVQFSDKMKNVRAGDYNGLLTVWSETKNQGTLWDEFVDLGLDPDWRPAMANFRPDHSLNFYKHANFSIDPNKWFDLEVRVNAQGSVHEDLHSWI